MSFTIILAAASDGTIGDKGGLPWRLPRDLLHFKTITSGKIVLMGRKTWESLPKRPLPNRENWVLTRDPNFKADGVRVFYSLEEVLNNPKGDCEEIMVIGGGEIYKMFFPYADTFYYTSVYSKINGDCKLEFLSNASWWNNWIRHDYTNFDMDEKDSHMFGFHLYTRKKTLCR